MTEPRPSGLLQQVSFLPFFLPAQLQRHQLEDVADYLNKSIAGSAKLTPSGACQHLIGTDHIQLAAQIRDVDIRLYVLSLGTGVLRIAWPPDHLKADHSELLEKRRNRHSELLEGAGSIGKEASCIVKKCTDAVKQSDVRPLFFLCRPPAFDYVFSLFEINMYGAAPSTRGAMTEPERALLMPSYYGLSDTAWQSTRTVRSSTGDEAAIKDIGIFDDVEMDATLQCRMSWASVVLSGEISEECREIYGALEVRTQGLWFFAHRVSGMEVAGDGSALDVETVANAFERAVRALLRLRDPMVNERIARIYASMVSSSGLEERIESARVNIAGIRGITTANEARRRSRFEAVTEILLFIIASLQLMPVVMETPVGDEWRKAMLICWAVVAVLFIICRSRA